MVLDNLKIILASPMHLAPVRKERRSRWRPSEAEFRLFSRAAAGGALLLLGDDSPGPGLHRASTTWRHYQTTRLNQPLRNGLRALGDRLVGRGVLEEPMDVFFAHREQIEAAVAAGTGAAWRLLGEQIRTQKAACQADAARETEWVLGESAPECASESGDMTAGRAAPERRRARCSGCCRPMTLPSFPRGGTGRARDQSDLDAALLPGKCGGHGQRGPLSHGAVTARKWASRL